MVQQRQHHGGARRFLPGARGAGSWLAERLAVAAPGMALGAGLLLSLDAWNLSLQAFLLQAGILGTLGLTVLGVDGTSRVLSSRLSPIRRQRSSEFLLVGGPAVHGVWLIIKNQELLPLWASGAVISMAALLLALPRAASRYRAAGALTELSPLWAFLLAWGWLLLHQRMGTFISVRPGTGVLHILLYVLTWAGTYFLCVLCARRSQLILSESQPPYWLGLVPLAAGLLFWEVDRRMFVGLYPEAHVWLSAACFLAVTTGISSLWASVSKKLVQRQTGAGVAAFTVLVVSVPLFARTQATADAAARASLAATAFGAASVYLVPGSGQMGARAEHIALSKGDQRLDQHLKGGPYDILLVSVDALRADALESAPRLKTLAERSLYFTRAYAQGSRTAIGMSALMLGRYSANIKWQLWPYVGGKIFDPARLTAEQLESFDGRFVYTTLPEPRPGSMLAERLKARGYATLAAPFAGANHFFRNDAVFARGFDVYADLTRKRWRTPSSDHIARTVLRQLKKAPRSPWFHWVHFYDPHEAGRSSGEYEKLVRKFDDALGTILDYLEPQLSRTIIAVISDHGEAFGEHGHFGHGSSLYEEQAAVPLVMYVPGVKAKKIDVPVAAIDLTATLLAAVGADTSELDGVNLLAFQEDIGRLRERPVFTELHRYLSNRGERTTDLKAVRQGRMKLIVDRRQETAQLFDLDTDPGELENVASSFPEELTRLRAIVEGFLWQEESLGSLP